MQEFAETGLVFKFPEGWGVYDYDGQDSWYAKIKGLITGLTAVDFLVAEEGGHWWIEVKSFRDFEGEDQRGTAFYSRISNEESENVKNVKSYAKRNNLHKSVKVAPKKKYLPEEIAKNVIDTWFGLTLALRKGEGDLGDYANHLIRGEKIQVVLVIDFPEESYEGEHKRLSKLLSQSIEQELRCCSVEVGVVTPEDYSTQEIFGWQVERAE